MKTDYLLIGTGVAPLLAAQRILNRGETVKILNPDPDFFLENSELPLDLLSFETTNTDLSKRFSNNLPEQMYRDLIQEFPGAIELWKEEHESNLDKPFQVESAPWIRYRERLWLTHERSGKVDRLENLYLRALDLGWKPKWLEDLSLAKKFPGFSAKNRELDGWTGFLGPRFGDIDVARYRTGLLEYVRERLGRDQIHTSFHLSDLNTKEVNRAVLYFWTPKPERVLRQNLEKNSPHQLPLFDQSVKRQNWEEWDIISRDPVNPYVVAQMEGFRLWSHGEGMPPQGGWNQVKIMRREVSNDLMTEASFQEISKVIFNLMGWERFTVRKMCPRLLYRWNQTAAIEFNTSLVKTKIISACDGPLHWIAHQVRSAIDGT